MKDFHRHGIIQSYKNVRILLAYNYLLVLRTFSPCKSFTVLWLLKPPEWELILIFPPVTLIQLYFSFMKLCGFFMYLTVTTPCLRLSRIHSQSLSTQPRQCSGTGILTEKSKGTDLPFLCPRTDRLGHVSQALQTDGRGRKTSSCPEAASGQVSPTVRVVLVGLLLLSRATSVPVCFQTWFYNPPENILCS